MFISNQYFWRKKRLSVDMYGEQIYSTSIRERCGVVTQRIETQRTSVRADTSGSVGAADMKRSKGRWMVESSSGIQRGDIVWLAQRPANVFEVEDVHPRYTTVGQLDHFEVDLATA